MEYISGCDRRAIRRGESTVARAVAARMGYVYVDTGAMYRAIGPAVPQGESRVRIRRGSSRPLPTVDISLAYQDGMQHVLLNGEDVSGSDPHAGNLAICVKGFGRAGGAAFFAGCTAGHGKKQQYPDGRTRYRHGDPAGRTSENIPDRLREKRGRERHRELKEKGQQVTLEGVLADIQARDRRYDARGRPASSGGRRGPARHERAFDLEQSIAAVLRIIREKTEIIHETEISPLVPMVRGSLCGAGVPYLFRL